MEVVELVELELVLVLVLVVERHKILRQPPTNPLSTRKSSDGSLCQISGKQEDNHHKARILASRCTRILAWREKSLKTENVVLNEELFKQRFFLCDSV